MSAGAVDCVVVGAGPAGLATSAALTARGVEHLLVERGQVGHTWRTQRWDSFRLNTPSWMNPMLGPFADDGYAPLGEVVERFGTLAAACPLREGVAVEALSRNGDGFALRTTDGAPSARAVVVATGDQNRPLTPALAAAVPAGVAQCHTAGYRSAGQLPEGAVLVVGSGQSGCQIAEDLLAGGRRVFVATSQVGRLPTPYRGRETLWWLVQGGFYDQTPAQVQDPVARRAPNPLIAPDGRPLGLPSLARRGAVLVGRPVAVEGARILLDDSAAANLAAGEAFAAQARVMADEIIERTGAGAPPAVPDPDDDPVRLEPVPAIDLRADQVGSVIWCTGFGGDFGPLDPSLLDGAGQPLRESVAGAVPGLWFMGLRWLTHRASSILYGFPKDAARVADGVVAHLGGAGYS